jgi:hypothetical protein
MAYQRSTRVHEKFYLFFLHNYITEMAQIRVRMIRRPRAGNKVQAGKKMYNSVHIWS